ncbi:MAG TPA: hypothetical protein VNK04_20900 [Gemmataceae bacterium]|jgi:hypothetical protein|nr:hypothetical protein [Gemmataceae bacterium]
MDPIQQRQQNQEAFRRMKDTLAQTYERGRFVAISEGRVIADAASLDVLRSHLQALGKDPTQVLIVQAGVEYPETAVIFVQGS